MTGQGLGAVRNCLGFDGRLPVWDPGWDGLGASVSHLSSLARAGYEDSAVTPVKRCAQCLAHRCSVLTAILMVTVMLSVPLHAWAGGDRLRSPSSLA